jgi:glycosyltransferase involved in cell wall biosynthesis
MNQIPISVIVLTYNRSDALVKVLESLALQCDSDDEIIIADDGSNQEHVRYLQSHLPKFLCPVIQVWHPDTGFTASRARNLGANKAKNEYLIFLDGDCVPHSEFLKRHRQLLEPGCFVNGSRVLISEGFTEEVLTSRADFLQMNWIDWIAKAMTGKTNKWFWYVGALTKLSYFVDFLFKKLRQHSRFKWRGIRSCNFGVWKKDFFAVNGFDESFQGWGHEDADLVLRLHQQGVTRKNGFWATEVFHLFHPQNPRVNESANRQRVLARMKQPQTLTDIGLTQLDKNSHDVVVKRLNENEEKF